MRIDLTTKPIIEKLRFCFNDKLGLDVAVTFDAKSHMWRFKLNNRKYEIAKLVALDFVYHVGNGNITSVEDCEDFFFSCLQNN